MRPPSRGSGLLGRARRAGCLLVLTALGPSGCRHGRAQTDALCLPNEAIGRAQSLSASGAADHGLIDLTAYLCERASSYREPATQLPHDAVASADIRLVNAWVGLWDTASRPAAPEQAVLLCLEGQPVAQLLRVSLADARGDWPAAVELADGRPANTPPMLAAELAMRHAIALLHLGRAAAATGELERSIAALPEHAGLYVALAQARLAERQFAAVGGALSPLLSLPAALSSGVLARARGLLQAAREGAAPALTPADLAEHADLIRLAEADAIAPDDLAHVEMVLRVSEQPQLLPWCALVLIKEGQAARGRALLRQASEALPLDPMPLRLLAAQNLTADDLDGALPALLEAARRDPFDVETQQLLARAARRTGAEALAEAAYQALVRLTPGDVEALNGLAAGKAGSRP